MKNRRAIFWLSLIVVLAIAAHFALDRAALNRGTHSFALRAGGTLFDAAFAPSRITLAPAGKPEIVLEKTDVWRLVKPYAATVDARAVLRLADRLTNARTTDIVSPTELLRFGRTRADYGLEPPALAVTLADGDRTVALDIGQRTPTTNAFYAAMRGSAELIVTPELITPEECEAAAYRVREAFPAGLDGVTAFTIRISADQTLSFERTGETWRLGENLASQTKVAEFLKSVAAVRAIDFIWPIGATNETSTLTAAALSGYRLDADSGVTVSLKGSDGIDRRIVLGAEASAGRVYALVQNASAVVTVDGAVKAAALQGLDAFADTRAFPLEEVSVHSFALHVSDVDYALVRGESDGAWRLEAPLAAPANAALVTKILKRILSLSTAEAESEGISVSVNTNTTRLVVAPKRILAGCRLEDLRSLDILKIDPMDIRRLVFTSGGEDAKPYTLVCDRTNKEVETLLKRFAPLKAARIVSLKATASDLKQYGLETPRLTVAIDHEREGTLRRNILIGARVSEGFYATVGSSEAVFILPNATVEAFEKVPGK